MLVNGTRQSSPFLTNRGLAYGDGVFETLRIHNGKLLFEQEHIDRLQRGLARLEISDCSAVLREDIDSIRPELPASGVLKIMVTRGPGGRGYRSSDVEPERFLTLHPLPATLGSPVSVFLCDTRLALNPRLAGIKHLNRLEQVLASREWPDDSFTEGLMLDMQNRVIEGTRSNVFAVIEGRVLTPVLEACGIDGVMRRHLLERLPECEKTELRLDDLERASELFFCNSVAGVWPVDSLRLTGGKELTFRPGEVCAHATELFSQALESLS